MVSCLKDTQKAEALFSDWNESLIWSCLQKTMGKILVVDPVEPKSACAFVGCFAFFAGEPNEELLSFDFGKYSILTPQNDAWSRFIETVYPNSRKATRYAIRKDTVFNRNSLSQLTKVPNGYILRVIDSDLYDACLKHPVFEDFVSVFQDKEDYLAHGKGVVVCEDERIVAGASSYTYYDGGIEIEVDTLPEERRKGLATAACASLILMCLKDGIYPSWDAQNPVSVKLAQKLGYNFEREYTVYILEK